MTGPCLPVAVHRIPLGNEEFEGRNNAYLFDGDGPTTLVDTGVNTDDVRSQLEAGLADRGVDLATVDRVVLTHWHPDHAGLAGEVQDVAGATVYVHEDDAPLVAGGRGEAFVGLYERRFEEWGMPDEKRDVVLGVSDASTRLAGSVADPELLEAGDVLEAGDDRLRVIHAPGHTAGQICLAIEGTGEALSGDAVLPVYTPNIGGADLRVDRPLPTYRESLRRIDGEGFDRLLPGHRQPIDDPADRIETILEHHRERTRRVVGVLDEYGPLSVWEVSAHLFGELSGVHVIHGPGEAFAHLDYLTETGDVEVEDGTYALVASPEDLAAE